MVKQDADFEIPRRRLWFALRHGGRLATVANVPDDVWIAAWTGSKSTTRIPPLSSGLWVHCHRLHQYHGGHNETWGGITFNIDNDAEMRTSRCAGRLRQPRVHDLTSLF